jgi:hypothetical protein
MNFLKCKELSGAFEFRRNGVRGSPLRSLLSGEHTLAAKRNVDMERARYDREEHRAVCVSYAQQKFWDR